MEQTVMPLFVEAFLSPVRDSPVAQTAVAAVLVLTLLDVAFGVACALLTRSYSSHKMREGIGHKCASLGFMMVGLVADGALVGGFDLGYGAPVLTSVCAYLCLMETGSLLETFAAMNPQLAGSPLFSLLKGGDGHGDE